MDESSKKKKEPFEKKDGIDSSAASQFTEEIKGKKEAETGKGLKGKESVPSSQDKEEEDTNNIEKKGSTKEIKHEEEGSSSDNEEAVVNIDQKSIKTSNKIA